MDGKKNGHTENGELEEVGEERKEKARLMRERVNSLKGY